MDPTICVGCRGKTVAEIKDLQSYDNHNVPVWYCEKCDLSVPTKREDRQLWVQRYQWDPPGLIYGGKLITAKCLGCDKETLYADSEFLINEYFPFWHEKKPAWTCYRCGYTDKVAKEDGPLWAEKFEGWKG